MWDAVGDDGLEFVAFDAFVDIDESLWQFEFVAWIGREGEDCEFSAAHFEGPGWSVVVGFSEGCGVVGCASEHVVQDFESVDFVF